MITTEQKLIAGKFLSMAVEIGKLSKEAANELLSENIREKNENIFLLKKEVAQILKCSIRQINKLVEKGHLKKHYIGTASPRFIKEEVLNLVFRRKIKK